MFDLTGSTVATGTAVVAETLPALLLGPLAGVFADRWQRRRTMVAVDLVRAGCVLALLAVRGSDQTAQTGATVAGAVLGRGAGLPVTRPARRSCWPPSPAGACCHPPSRLQGRADLAAGPPPCDRAPLGRTARRPAAVGFSRKAAAALR